MEQAIIDFCRESDSIAGGVVGPSFSCSGPGSGRSENHDTTDYAARSLALDYGATSYVDHQDGREATLDDDNNVEWSKHSMVMLVTPEEDDALAYPDALAEMATALINYHSPASYKGEWSRLLQSIRDTAKKIADLDLDSLN